MARSGRRARTRSRTWWRGWSRNPGSGRSSLSRKSSSPSVATSATGRWPGGQVVAVGEASVDALLGGMADLGGEGGEEAGGAGDAVPVERHKDRAVPCGGLLKRQGVRVGVGDGARGGVLGQAQRAEVEGDGQAPSGRGLRGRAAAAVPPGRRRGRERAGGAQERRDRGSRSPQGGRAQSRRARMSGRARRSRTRPDHGRRRASARGGGRHPPSRDPSKWCAPARAARRAARRESRRPQGRAGGGGGPRLSG